MIKNKTNYKKKVKNRNIKTLIIILLIIIFLYIVNYINTYESIKINNYGYSTELCLLKNEKLTYELESNNNKFKVKYIKNAPNNCKNQLFPVISIYSESSRHNAWLHMIYTDSHDKKFVKYIDSTESNFPIHSYGKNFYSSHFIDFGLFKKPFYFFRGHSYSVHINNDTRTIEFLGGVSWGYNLNILSIKPDSFDPHVLSIIDWKRDWGIFKQEFYNFNYSTQ